MTRRLQLLDPESRSSGRSVSTVISRVRDGLLRDNKVIPAVLGVLALLIFAWLVAGALIGGPDDEEEQQASNQASLAQGDDSDSGDAETPAPGVENRDSDASYGGYDEGPKDPFRQIIPKAGEEDGGGQNDRGSDEDDRNSGGANGGRSGNSRNGGTGRGGDGGGDNEDFIEQRSPGGSGSRSAPGRGGQGSASQDGAGQAGAGQGGSGQGGVGQAGGGGGLFNSGGDLPAP
ncbi:MAG: hypothetical protein LC781_01885 [Actinobacteria bacterium]|nr:hypothetical protein [Actinomycetota bacterium]